MLFKKVNYVFSIKNLFLVIILIVCFFSFLQITNYKFLQWDDDIQITNNAYVRNLNWQSIHYNFVKEKFTLLTLTIYSVIYQIWGKNPAPFHWLSILLHLLNVILIFQLVRKFSKNVFTISFVTLLFALHPMRVESVAWISELKDLLFTVFSLGAFLIYIEYIKKNFKFYLFILASLMVVLATFSKVQGLIVPVSFFLIDLFNKRKISLESLLEKVFLILFLFYFFIFFTLQTSGIMIALFFIYFLFKKRSLIESYFLVIFQKGKYSTKAILRIGILTLSFYLIYYILKFFQLGIAGVLIPLLITYLLLENRIFNENAYNKKKFIRIGLISLAGLFGLVFLIYYIQASKLALWNNDTGGSITFSFFERFLLMGYALWFYIKNFFFPVSLNAVHPYPMRLSNGGLPSEYYFTLLALIIVIAFSIFLIVKRKKFPDLFFFGWFFFLINIFLVLHLIPIKGRLVVADRYSYLAYFGLFVSVASLGERYLFQKEKLKYILLFCLAILLGVFSFLTYNRCKVWKDTKTLFSDVLNKNPKIPFAYNIMAASYRSINMPDSALFCYEKAIKLDSLDPYSYFNRAFSFMDKKDDEKALKDFFSFVGLTRSEKFKALAYAHIGEIYKSKGADSLSIHYFDLAVNTDSTVSYAYNKRGVYYLNSNSIDKAFSDFKKAVELDIYYAEAYNNLGSVYMSKADIKNAQKNFNRAIELEPDYIIAYYNRGFLKYNNNDAAGAIKDYNEAIKLNPAFSQAYIQRGRAYAQMRDYKTAIDDFSFVLKKEPGNMVALTNRAYAWFYIQEMTKAENDFLSITKLYSGSAVAWQNQAWFHMQLKNYNSAIREYEKSIELDSTLINSYINVGWIYMEIKDYENADKVFKHSLALNPNSSESLYSLGELNRKKGDNETSCEYYSKASNLGNRDAKNALNLYCPNSDRKELTQP